jgi:hypothetical protein
MFKKTIAVGPFDPFAGEAAVANPYPFNCRLRSRVVGLILLEVLFEKMRDGTHKLVRSAMVYRYMMEKQCAGKVCWGTDHT